MRKLEFLLAEAREKGADCVVTLGGVQSNHARATAAAARIAGLDAHLVLRTSRARVDDDPGIDGNLLVSRLVGATIHLVTKEEYAVHGQRALGEAICAKLRAAGRRPYLIPVGGSSAAGTLGYVEMVAELQAQAAAAGLAPFTDIALACGSGGTAAGVALGVALAGLAARVTAYMVCDDEAYFAEHVAALCAELGAAGAARAAAAGSGGLLRFVQAKGAGYALARPDELATLRDVAHASGVVLDACYTGKAAHALLGEMAAAPAVWRGRKVLFLHTGGAAGNAGQAGEIAAMLAADPGGVQRLGL